MSSINTSSLDSLLGDATDSYVAAFWMQTCNKIFPSSYSYRLLNDDNTYFLPIPTRRVAISTQVRFRYTALLNDTIPYRSEYEVLVIGCKQAHGETPQEWEGGLLIEHLEHRLDKACSRVFAALAIGTRVKFWKWDREGEADKRLTPLHEGVYDLQKEEHRALVQEGLTSIRERGLRWVLKLEKGAELFPMTAFQV